MLNVRRTRGWAIVSCLACAAMVIASTAMAKGDQKSEEAQKQNQQQATASQNAGQSGQQAAESQQSRQAEEQNQQASQKQTSQQDQAENSQQSEKAKENKQAKGKRGAHLGVGITTDKTENGVLVVQIRPNTAAQKMGLQRHDRITELNGEKVKSADGFISDISNMNPGDKVELKVVRNGNERTIKGELEGYSESYVETQGPRGTHEYRQFQSYIDPNARNSEQAGRDQNLDRQHEGTQANYENRGESNESANGSLESRVSRLEQEIEHLGQKIDELATNANQAQTASAQKNSSSNTKTK